MTEPKINAAAIEIAVSTYFERARNFAIPNVKWGFRGINYEIDLMVVTSSLYAYEVEIKISASDLKRDRLKYKWGYCKNQHYFRKSYYAIPEALLKYQEFIPEYAGILVVSYNTRQTWFVTREARAAAIDTLAKKVTPEEYQQLGRLCMLRMWDLKINSLKRSLNGQQEALG